MARFRATIQGNRGEASRLGQRRIIASINGWEIGCDVTIFINEAGNDCLSVRVNGGSNNGKVFKAYEYTRERLDLETRLVGRETL